MNYTQFIAYAMAVNRNYNNFMWLHYSKFHPSNQKEISDHEERSEEKYEEKYEEKDSS